MTTTRLMTPTTSSRPAESPRLEWLSNLLCAAGSTQLLHRRLALCRVGIHTVAAPTLPHVTKICVRGTLFAGAATAWHPGIVLKVEVFVNFVSSISLIFHSGGSAPVALILPSPCLLCRSLTRALGVR
jgi:hypothetical protein